MPAARPVAVALALHLACLAAPIASRADDPVQVSEEAREAYERGVELLEDPDRPRYQEAYDAFARAYALSPSPRILGKLGLCAVKLERDGEAIEALSTYLTRVSDIPERERAQLEEIVAALEASLVVLELTVEPPGATVVDARTRKEGDDVVNRYGPIDRKLRVGMRPGTHRLTVEHEGYAPAIVELEAIPGRPLSERVTLRRPKLSLPDDPDREVLPITSLEPLVHRPTPTSVYIGLVATGALVATTVGVGAVALSNKGAFDDENDGQNPSRALELRDTGVGLNLATDVLLGVSVAAAAVTGVLYLTRPSVPIDVALVPTGTGLAAIGSF